MVDSIWPKVKELPRVSGSALIMSVIRLKVRNPTLWNRDDIFNPRPMLALEVGF